MQLFSKRILQCSTAAMVFFLAASFNACVQNSPVQPERADSSGTAPQLAKPGGPKACDTYVQTDSVTLKAQPSTDSYRGGRMSVPSGSYLVVSNGAFTPPDGTPPGQDVTLTMTVTKDATGLHYEFGPHGSTFNPPAELWFDWHDLGSRRAQLYYIDESGNWIAQQPDYDDKRGKRFMLYINHFSRYAIAHSQ